MPYNVNTGDCMEITIDMRMNGQVLLSVFHYLINTGGGPVDGVTAIEEMNVLWNSSAPDTFLSDYAGCITGAVTINAIVFQWITTTRRARVVKAPEVTGGILTGDTMPQNLAAAITKRSETAGRRGVGTLHMPAILVANVSAGQLTTTGLAVYDDFLPRLSEEILLVTSGRMIPVVYHRTNPALSAPITGAEQQRTVRTMHRRTVGVGQ